MPTSEQRKKTIKESVERHAKIDAAIKNAEQLARQNERTGPAPAQHPGAGLSQGPIDGPF
jgi:hypothetical protein